MDSSRLAAAKPWTRSLDVNALHVFSKFSCVSCPHRARSQGTTIRSCPGALLRDGGQCREPDYASRNPSQLIPTLENNQYTYATGVLANFRPRLFPMQRSSSNLVTEYFTVEPGVRIAADIGGDPSAPPVVLLHGGGQTRHSWGKALRELVARGYYVLNLDARGHGDSDWSSDGKYSLDVLARDLENIV